MQTRARDRRSAHSPSRKAARASPAMPLPAPAGRPRPATLQARRSDGRLRRILPRQAPSRRSERSERSAPPFGLTLRAMLGKRHRQARATGRSVVGFLSVLVLMALACFPVFAQADSSGIQYSDAPPTATGGGQPPAGHDPSARSSGASGGATAPSHPGTSGSSGAGSSADDPSSSTGGAAARDGGTGQGSPGQGATGTQGDSVQQTSQTAAETSSSDDGGGSSPLVPILIGIAALAAISVGAMAMRSRRRDPGAPVSSKAS